MQREDFEDIVSFELALQALRLMKKMGFLKNYTLMQYSYQEKNEMPLISWF